MYELKDLTVRINWTLHKATLSNWTDIRHNTSVHTLYWVHEGKGVFHTTGLHEVERGMLFYMEPGLQMRMESSDTTPLQMSMILFECAEVLFASQEWHPPRTLAQLAIPFKESYTGGNAVRLDRAFRELVSLWIPGNPIRELETGAQLLRIMSWLHGGLDSTKGNQATSAFEQIKSTIEQHFSEPLSMDEMARKHAISPSYLRKLFLRHTLLTPKQYLTQVRLQHAERYLTYTTLPLSGVAQACGYSDEFHFSKAFRKSRGSSPSMFRKSLVKGNPLDLSTVPIPPIIE